MAEWQDLQARLNLSFPTRSLERKGTTSSQLCKDPAGFIWSISISFCGNQFPQISQWYSYFCLPFPSQGRFPSFNFSHLGGHLRHIILILDRTNVQKRAVVQSGCSGHGGVFLLIYRPRVWTPLPYITPILTANCLTGTILDIIAIFQGFYSFLFGVVEFDCSRRSFFH